MNQILEENKNLIYAIMKYFKGYNNQDDLFQVGCIGLINAYNKYNPNMGVKFSTYAYTYIWGEMKKLVREDKSIKISRDISSLNNKIEDVKSILCQKLNREPSIKELSSFLEIDEYTLSEAINSNNCVDSFDYVINDDGKDLTLYDLIGNNLSLDELIDLRSQLEKLEPVEQKIILSRYMNDLTQSETAQLLGINQVQVCRTEKKILTKLKNKLTI